MQLNGELTHIILLIDLGTGHYLSPGGGVGVFRGGSHGLLKTFRGDQP